METRTSPELTVSPLLTLMEATVPSCGATISFSIFMASRITSTSPAFTDAPALTLTSRMLPGMGALTATWHQQRLQQARSSGGVVARGGGRSRGRSGSHRGGSGARVEPGPGRGRQPERERRRGGLQVGLFHGDVSRRRSYRNGGTTARILQIKIVSKRFIQTITELCCRASWAGGQHAWCSAVPVRQQRLHAHWLHRRSGQQRRRQLHLLRCTPRRCSSSLCVGGCNDVVGSIDLFLVQDADRCAGFQCADGAASHGNAQIGSSQSGKQGRRPCQPAQPPFAVVASA